ncbi:hypothetical protein DLM75_07325 [Leptospira stimsonii]|uniref:Uncharacterized protein n=1 Tax=Leptospira stimsonii TaxID=2202203 RepID=A0A396ZIE8_9LEPT|nr:hypothetical protein DLM75_07325 [Leptospira stimsonii]
MQKDSYRDKAKSPDFSHGPASTTRDQGGARDFYEKIVVSPTGFIFETPLKYGFGLRNRMNQSQFKTRFS